jgi:hypothetical protein
MFDRDQRWEGGNHSSPENTLVLDSHKLESVEGPLDRMWLPRLPRQFRCQINTIPFVVKNLMVYKVSALQTVNAGLPTTRDSWFQQIGIRKSRPGIAWRAVVHNLPSL